MPAWVNGIPTGKLAQDIDNKRRRKQRRRERWGLAGFIAWVSFIGLVSLAWLGLLVWAIISVVNWLTAQ